MLPTFIDEKTKKLNVTASLFSFIIMVLSGLLLCHATPSLASDTIPTPTISSPRIVRYLKMGMSGNDVALLQQVLKNDPDTYFQAAIVGRFGIRTFKAVKSLQAEYNLPETGVVGPLTLAVVNTLIEYGPHTNPYKSDAMRLQSAIKNTTTTDSLPVLIDFFSIPGTSELDLVRSGGGKISYIYHLIPAIAAEVPKSYLLTLLSNPIVKTIEIDRKLRRLPADNYDTNATSTASMSFTAQTSTGDHSVSVAIIDTGIDYNHKDLRGYYTGGYNFINSTNDGMDDNGHGTMMAGFIVKTFNNFSMPGTTSTNLRLYGLKALDASGTGYYRNIIAALEWAVDRKIPIINNSYATQMSPGKIFQEAFDNADLQGSLLLASVGNSGACDNKDNSVEFPAKYSSVFAVAAVDGKNNRPCFSSTGPEVEIAAPGVALITTAINGGYAYSDGTSVATAYVSGAAALMIANGIKDSNNNGRVNDDIRKLLDGNSDNVDNTNRNIFYGFGILDIPNALKNINSVQTR
jgi:subtilisin family serine protease